MGSTHRFAAIRGTALFAVFALVLLSLGGMKSADAGGRGAEPPNPGGRGAEPPASPILTARAVDDAGAPPLRAERWRSDEWGVEIVPPAGWLEAPAESLNPLSDPPDPVFEVARFQLRVGDPTLYAQPVALTSGLLADARAVVSIGVAREGTGLVGADPDRMDISSRTSGFVGTDDDQSYEGLRTFTRYLYATSTDRVVVVRLIADEEEWSTVASPLFDSLRSVRAEPDKAHGPEVLPPLQAPAPPAPVEVMAQVVDPSLEIRGQMLQRASTMLGIPYVWGGNSTRTGMDCSAWLSRVWGVERYSTDSIWQVSFPITKEELRPGDALNLTVGRDPRRLGHIRMFEAWANPAHTLMWVYEETPPRSLHRVIAYDDRYEPIRLAGLTGAGVALIVPGTPAPERTSPPRPNRATPRATPRPPVRATVKPTPRPTLRTTPRPTLRVTPRPTLRVTPRPTATITVPKPTPTPAPTVRERD